MRLHNSIKKTVATICCISMMGAMLVGCGGKDEVTGTNSSNSTQTTDTTTSDLSGTITMVGSTSMEKLALAVAEDFMAKNSMVTVNAEFVGSGAGIEAVANGTADIGNSSRNLKESEIASGVIENIVAIDGIAVVVNKANTVAGVTKEQLIGIYQGTIRNWKELGGNDSPIVVIGRESASGTRAAFEEILGIKDECLYANELDNTGAVMAKVASIEGAVGYVSIDVVDDSVHTLAFDGAEATTENIKSGNYTLSRPFVMATKGEINEQNELIQAFFTYLKSDEGKKIIKQVGLVTVD